ncbi:hypothetical protein GOODEAATRI_023847 [Goodea atripinnis]|uniref:Uncharacterized protein n=1 Tax=Goodea atripinnis TaxID=208336 RepID=A0ABV0MUL8_9TELE
MTITPEVRNEQSTYAEAPIGTKVEEIQREKSLQEATAEAGREEQQAEDRESGDKDREKEEKKEENLPEESLRMASWVEVSNERLSAVEKSEAGAELMEEEARDNAEDQEPLEVEERSTGEVEKDQTRSVEAELAVMEEKWRVQCVINDTLKQRLANEEGRFRELQRYKSRQRELEAGVQGAEAKQTMVLRYPLPYPQDPSPPPLVPQRPAELQYGNPYSTETSKDRVDVILSPEHLSRPPPEAPLCAAPCAPPVSPPSPSPGAPGWDQEVVCIQPSRSTTPPENMEAPAEEAQKVCDRAQQPCDHPSSRRSEVRSSFCFDSR